MNEVKLTAEQVEMLEAYRKALPYMRHELGVSQTQLGDKIGKSRQTISMIERGTIPLCWDTFVSIMYFFKVNWGKIEPDSITVLDEFLKI